MEDFFEKGQLFFKKHPGYFGIIMVLLGIYVIWAARNPNSSLYSGTYSSKITIGSIAAWFGPTIAKYFAYAVGVCSIICGIVMFILFEK